MSLPVNKYMSDDNEWLPWTSVGMSHVLSPTKTCVCLNAGMQYQQRTKVSSLASSTGKHTGITLYMNKNKYFKGWHMCFVRCIYIVPSQSLVIQSVLMQTKSEHVQQLIRVNICWFERVEKIFQLLRDVFLMPEWQPSITKS